MADLEQDDFTAPELNPELLKALAGRLRAKAGIDLFSYKPRLLRRRVLVRMRARKCRGMKEYLALIDADASEWVELVRALSIHVSGFFRNQETFFCLRDEIFPELIRQRRQAGRPLFLVSAGCAEGEEPYGVAVLLRHEFAAELSGMGVRIVGLDLGEEVLTRARKGAYHLDRIQDLPEEYRAKYFTKQGKSYILREEVRRMVEFSAHDLREGLPFQGVDVVFCRNVLIYYQREHQERILRGFHRSLAADGYMVLGKTEMLLGRMGTGFAAVNLTEHIYRKQ